MIKSRYRHSLRLNESHEQARADFPPFRFNRRHAVDLAESSPCFIKMSSERGTTEACRIMREMEPHIVTGHRSGLTYADAERICAICATRAWSAKTKRPTEARMVPHRSGLPRLRKRSLS